jgi:hypothetical protein
METFGIETSKPIAYDSPDHIQPHGTASNNTTSPRFNGKLFEYIPAGEVRLLDIGCSGGGLVKSILDEGGFGIGIEGSDYSLSGPPYPTTSSRPTRPYRSNSGARRTGGGGRCNST